MDASSGLEFFISEKGSFAVINFIGVINSATVPILEKCQAEIGLKTAKCWVLTFHDVTNVETGGVPAIAKLQKLIRDKRSYLRICFLRPEIKRLLVEKSTIRESEVANNLAEALLSLKTEIAQEEGQGEAA